MGGGVGGEGVIGQVASPKQGSSLRGGLRHCGCRYLHSCRIRLAGPHKGPPVIDDARGSEDQWPRGKVVTTRLYLTGCGQFRALVCLYNRSIIAAGNLHRGYWSSCFHYTLEIIVTAQPYCPEL